MRLVGQLSNPSSSLERVLEAPNAALAARPSSMMTMPECARLGNGVVLRAVVKVLSTADHPMRLREIRAAVGELLGQPVSVDSLNWSLRKGCHGKRPCFERVTYGIYRLRSQT